MIAPISIFGRIPMRALAFTAILAALLPFAGCDQNQKVPPPPPPNNRPAVEVQAPNVDVKTGKEGTSVKTPGADVEVQKK
jgi:hypothetical protein